MAVIHAERHRGHAGIKPAQPPALTRRPAGEIALLLRLIDESYDRKAWHGPNLKGSIRRLSAREAAWRPSPEPIPSPSMWCTALLEICGQAAAHWRKTRLIRTQREQLVHDRLALERSLVERIHHSPRPGTSRAAQTIAALEPERLDDFRREARFASSRRSTESLCTMSTTRGRFSF